MESRVSPGGMAGRGTSVVPIEFHAGTHVSTTLGSPFDSHTKTQNYREKKRKKKTFKIGNISFHGYGQPCGFVIESCWHDHGAHH